jgi:N-acylneuraminate cytidylyltransferase
MSPRAVAIIPVRGSDPETKGGRSISIGSKPLLAHTIEAAAASRFIDRIIVTTDDPEVARLAKEQGAEAPFLRPAALSAPGVPLAAVLQDALARIEQDGAYRADVVVLLEMTHPVRPAGLIDRVVEALIAEELDSVFAAREERHEFWTFASDGTLERVQPRDELPRQVLQPLYKEMGGMATAVRAELIRAGKRMGERVGLVPLRDASSLIDLHDEDGLKLAKALLEQKESVS